MLVPKPKLKPVSEPELKSKPTSVPVPAPVPVLAPEPSKRIATGSDSGLESKEVAYQKYSFKDAAPLQLKVSPSNKVNVQEPEFTFSKNPRCGNSRFSFFFFQLF